MKYVRYETLGRVWLALAYAAKESQDAYAAVVTKASWEAAERSMIAAEKWREACVAVETAVRAAALDEAASCVCDGESGAETAARILALKAP